MHLSTAIASAMGMAAMSTAISLPKEAGWVNLHSGLIGSSVAPYHVSIEHLSEPACSGVIIYKNFILTAAGCVAGGRPHEFVIRLGTPNAKEGGQLAAVKDLQIHPLFIGDLGSYDVAILTLEEDLVYRADVNQAPLVKRNAQPPIAGSPSTVTGYDHFSKHFKLLEVPVWDRDECALYYADSKPIANTTFCAGYFPGEQGQCDLDVGAPLIGAETGELIGLASSQYDCVPLGVPGVYTSIDYVHSWISIVTGL